MTSHNATAIEPKWLVEVAPQFFKVADSNKISKRKRQEKIEPLFNKVLMIHTTKYFHLGSHELSMKKLTSGDYLKSKGVHARYVLAFIYRLL